MAPRTPARGDRPTDAAPAAFAGVPTEALTFYAQLEADNSKAWWAEHKPVYDASVRAPMAAIVDSLAPQFGRPHVFRPNRDVRFGHDKSPYKTHQGAYCAPGDGGAYYVHVDADGFFAGGGMYAMARDQLARYRRAVQEDLPGEALERIVADLVAAGYEIGGERLATRPRGVPADHPRLALLRHKALSARLDWGTPGWLHTPRALDEVRSCWSGARPLVEWLGTHVGQSDLPRR